MKLFLLGSTLQEQRHEMSRIDGPILAENSRTIHPLYSSTVYCIGTVCHCHAVVVILVHSLTFPLG